MGIIRAPKFPNTTWENSHMKLFLKNRLMQSAHCHWERTGQQVILLIDRLEAPRESEEQRPSNPGWASIENVFTIDGLSTTGTATERELSIGSEGSSTGSGQERQWPWGLSKIVETICNRSEVASEEYIGDYVFISQTPRPKWLHRNYINVTLFGQWFTYS